MNIHDRLLVLALLLASLNFSAMAAAQEQPLLHWNFDSQEATRATDLSGNGLHADVTAELVASAMGQAVAMDGDARKLVSIDLPEGKRLGMDSWTIMAMLRPQRFDIDDAQNRRRFVSYGAYPKTSVIVIEVTGDGCLSISLSYRDEDGNMKFTGASSGFAMIRDAWSHVAVVCDRQNGRVILYLNGFPIGNAALPEHYQPDYGDSGRLTVGSNWHNFIGLIDDVTIYRAALSPDSVKTSYERLCDAFKPVDSEELAAARSDAKLREQFDKIRVAWKQGQWAGVRRLCQELIDAADAPAHYCSYAHLRIAQSYLAERNTVAALDVYQTIAATAAYPNVHREEARQSADELRRVSEGLPLQDPAASRTEVPVIESFAAEVFVGSDGDDDNGGTRTEPFATLTRARDELRKLKARAVDGPKAVTVLPGRYPITGPLELSAEDSGDSSAAIVYRADEPGSVVFYGGRRLSGFVDVTDEAIRDRLPAESRDRVVQCDLKAMGISDYGKLRVRGFSQGPSPPTLELFVDGVPMTLARWPNQGFVGIDKLVQPGSRQDNRPSIIQYVSDRHERWVGVKDAWLFGYFHYLWADATIEIAEINPAAKTITTVRPYYYGGNGMSTQQGIQYYAFNLLEEIDMPGEWYLDRETGLLYLYPPSNRRDFVAEIGLLASPMIRMSGASYVQFRNLTFDLARSVAIEADSCNDCWFVGCTISRFAGDGLMINGGTNNRVIGTDINRIGRGAMLVRGGDRQSLTPGGHVVENCTLHDFGRIDRTYTPAIQLEGVGNRVAHNLMYDGPSSAMRIEGNDHRIEFNEVHSMVKESDDQGAMELFRNPSYRGVVFRYNYFHDIGKTDGGASVHGQAAIRFDDAISGMLVYGNIFRGCGSGHFGAIQINSGRDNLIDNNLFVDCKQGLSGGWRSSNNVWVELRTGKGHPNVIQTDLYLRRYPKIATMLDEPAINHLWRNVFYQSGPMAAQSGNLDLFENVQFSKIDPGLKVLVTPELALDQKTAAQQSIPFKPIPIKRIGLYESVHRAGKPK